MSGKKSRIIWGILFFITLCPFLWGCYSIAAHKHKWVDAGCTTAKTCSVCGDTDGEPLGHQWEAAACDTPEICSICGILGKPRLGHDFDTTGKITIQPTCQTSGEKVYPCLRCGEIKTVVLQPVHQPGDWQTVENSATSALLTEAQYCTVCGTEYHRRYTKLPASGDNRGENIEENGAGSSFNTSAGISSGISHDSNASASSGSKSGSGLGNGSNGDNFNTYDNESQQQTSSRYVLNTRTMKFHYPSCRDVRKISPNNYATSNSSRDSLISSGWDTCGHCRP